MVQDGKPRRRGPRKTKHRKTAAAWNEKIGARWCEVRQLFDMTQADIAVILDESRVSVTHIENGRTALSLEQAVRLMRELQMSLDAFVELEQITPELLALQQDAAALPPATITVIRNVAQMFAQEFQRYRQKLEEA